MNASFLAEYPEIIAVVIALSGFAVAGLLANWFGQLLDMLERGVRRLSPGRAEQLAALTPRTLIQRVVYYVSLIFFLLLAVRVLGIGALSTWLDTLLGYIPQTLLGGIIIVGGYLLGILTYSLVAGILPPQQGPMLPRLAQVIVVLTAIMTGLGQMAINVSFIANVMVILLATGLGGLALAFALGSRDLVASLLARRTITHFALGDVVEIGNTRGKIIELGQTTVVLETSHGKSFVPNASFLKDEVRLITDE